MGRRKRRRRGRRVVRRALVRSARRIAGNGLRHDIFPPAQFTSFLLRGPSSRFPRTVPRRFRIFRFFRSETDSRGSPQRIPERPEYFPIRKLCGTDVRRAKSGRGNRLLRQVRPLYRGGRIRGFSEKQHTEFRCAGSAEEHRPVHGHQRMAAEYEMGRHRLFQGIRKTGSGSQPRFGQCRFTENLQEIRRYGRGLLQTVSGNATAPGQCRRSSSCLHPEPAGFHRAARRGDQSRRWPPAPGQWQCTNATATPLPAFSA